MNSFGDTAPWGESAWDVRVVASPREVFLWRAKLSGAGIFSPQQALLLVQAIGRKLSTFDIRGITVSGEGGESSVDVVYTSPDYMSPPPWKWPPGWDTASDISGFVTTDSDVRASFPSLQVVSANLLELTGPPASVDFWLSRTILWDSGIGPMQSFVDRQGVYKGIADDGSNAKPWKSEASLVEPQDVLKNKSGIGGLILVAGVAAVAWLGSRLLK
jgi:hypothetical protein